MARNVALALVAPSCCLACAVVYYLHVGDSSHCLEKRLLRAHVEHHAVHVTGAYFMEAVLYTDLSIMISMLLRIKWIGVCVCV